MSRSPNPEAMARVARSLEVMRAEMARGAEKAGRDIAAFMKAFEDAQKRTRA